MNNQIFTPDNHELERDVQSELLNWKKKHHKRVLQVEGPRQVGKTHEVKKFASKNYEQVIYVNLVRDEYGFEDLLDEKTLLPLYCEKAGLSSYKDDESTVLIIDEIQESTTVYNAIRDLRERWKCDMIVSGSYLARTVKSKDFFLPAGIAYLRMFPLSFREFCRALDLEQILMNLDISGGSPEEEYARLEAAYQAYRHIGGYPEVVTTYLETKSEADCMDVLESLIQTFTAESSRFFSNSTALSIFNETYKAVMVQILEEKKGTGKNLIEQVTDFVKDSVKEPVSRNEVRAASSWLLYSGIIGYCDLYNNGDVTDVVSNRRAYFMDNGIANYISKIVTMPNDAIEGMFTETFAYTELNHLYQKPIAVRQVRGDKPCFSTCGDYELDFVVVAMSGKRIGIEVKTGDNKARSLEFFKQHGMIDEAYRAGASKGGLGTVYKTIPVYMIGVLDRDQL